MGRHNLITTEEVADPDIDSGISGNEEDDFDDEDFEDAEEFDGSYDTDELNLPGPVASGPWTALQ